MRIGYGQSDAVFLVSRESIRIWYIFRFNFRLLSDVSYSDECLSVCEKNASDFSCNSEIICTIPRQGTTRQVPQIQQHLLIRYRATGYQHVLNSTGHPSTRSPFCSQRQCQTTRPTKSRGVTGVLENKFDTIAVCNDAFICGSHYAWLRALVKGLRQR